ncbi:MAG: AMIN domain-containing protein [Desulfobulbaceae bacterium]|nr:MAG: AMIN domain-containing protein [Desulfobulbaceae bacterium]
MKWSAQLFFLGIVLFFWSGALNAESEKNEGALIESISYEKDDDNLETIIFKLNGTHIPKIFKIKGEKPRLVFDFIDTRYSNLINNIINTEGNLIKSVRVGIHNDPPKTRVVVDLKPEQEFKFEQDFLASDNILSITFHRDNQELLVAADSAKKEESAKAEDTSNDTNHKKVTPKETPQSQVVSEKASGQAKNQTSPELPDQQTATPRPGGVTGTVTTPKPSPANRPEPPSPATAPQAEKKVAVSESVETAPNTNPILDQIEETQSLVVDPILMDVSFESTENDSEMVLFKLNDFYPPIVFGIEKGNPRVVCDFLDTALGKNVKPVINTGGGYVNRIRTARHAQPEKVRVVLDLVPSRNYDLQQVFFKEDNLFVIIISEFDEEPLPTLAVPENPIKSE